MNNMMYCVWDWISLALFAIMAVSFVWHMLRMHKRKKRRKERAGTVFGEKVV